MRRFLVWTGILLIRFLSFCPLWAQNPSPNTGAPYLLPQTIFVGDNGRLVIPLDQLYADIDPFVLDTVGILDGSADLVLKRIELERRGGSSRLLVDFIPYAPGVLTLPPLDFYVLSPDIPVPAREETRIPALTGLKVQVASILNPSQMTLSNPAPPLAAPGTSFLIYAFLIFVLVILFLGIGLSVWGRRHFSELWERFRQRRLIRLMSKFLRRIKMESIPEKDGKAAYYLSVLSAEFRRFLTLFTRINYNSFSAEEFLESPFEYGEDNASPVLKASFLFNLFRSWDTLRFSGRFIELSDLFHALSETDRFISALDKAVAEKPLGKSGKNSGSALSTESAQTQAVKSVYTATADGGMGF